MPRSLLGLANPAKCIGGFPQIVLPDAEDAPTLAAEGAGHEAVAGLITGQLVFPERMVVGRDIGVLRAGLPETTVHEDGEACFSEDGGQRRGEAREDLNP